MGLRMASYVGHSERTDVYLVTDARKHVTCLVMPAPSSGATLAPLVRCHRTSAALVGAPLGQALLSAALVCGSSAAQPLSGALGAFRRRCRSLSMKKWYWVDKCPREKNCSSQPWAKARKVCCGASEEVVRRILARRLECSSLHELPHDEAVELAAAWPLTETEAKDDDDLEQGEKPLTPSASPRRRRQRGRSSRRHRERSRSRSGRQTDAKRRRRASTADAPAAPATSRSGLMLENNEFMLDAVSRRGETSTSAGPRVLISESILMSTLDSLERAQRALRHAQRLSAAAAAAFDTEAAVVADAISSLRGFPLARGV